MSHGWKKFFSISPYAALAAILFLLNATFLWMNFRTVSGHQDALKHTYQVTHQLDLLFSAARDAESGIRGYILTKDLSFVDSYHQTRLEIWNRFHQISQLTSDNPSQTATLTTVEQALRERLEQLEKLISIVERTGDVRLIPQASFRSSKASMDALKSQVQQMQDEEERLLDLRSERTASSQKQFLFTLFGTTLLSILVIGWSLNQIWRNQRKVREASEHQARDSELKQRVVELSQVLSNPLHVDQVANEVLAHLSRLLSFAAARIYFVESSKLQLIGSLGASNDVSATELDESHHLASQSLISRKFVEIRNVPENYFVLSSGLGKRSPRVLNFQPVGFENQILALIEMASFEPLTQSQQAALDRFLPAIGSGLNSSRKREQLAKLLSQTQEQAHVLQTQQEELRATNEELEQQAEELQTQQEELRTTNEELAEQARLLEIRQKTLNDRNLDLEKARLDSEKKAADLIKANQYKSEFLAKMSHELRTPLNSLLILSSLLVENKEKNLSTQQKEFAQSIYSAGHDLLGLINDILDLSKIEAQKLSLRPENFTLGALASHIQKTFEIQAQAKGLKFTVEIPQEIESQRLWTDRQRIEQVLRNFLSNSVKFTEKGEIRFELSLMENSDWVRLQVQDTGIGIPESKKNLIFEAFEQADSSISRKYGGTGLGLTISKELATFLGGRIRVESQEGQGSRFILEIPMHLAEAAHSSETEFLTNAETAFPLTQKMDTSESEHPPVTKENPSSEAFAEAMQAVERISSDRRALLVIEDNAEFSQKLSDLARQKQFEPIQVGTAEAALEVLNQRSPSAIMLDLELPGMSGVALLETLKQKPQYRDIPVHVFSGGRLAETVLRMGASGYSEKPVSIGGLESALDKMDALVAKKEKRVLVVEDNDRQRDAIVQLIGGNDVQTVAVKNGQEGLTLLKNENFDCVVLDLELPDLSGYEVLEDLHSMQRPFPPVVIYTGREISEKEEEHLRRFSESIIIKGARSPERLLDEVNLFLHRLDNALPDNSRQALEKLRLKDDFFDQKTILLADDDLRNVFALTNALESWGANVRIARNGLEAIELLEENDDVEMILMDLMMPKMDGFEAMRAIRSRKRYAKIPIIALTAKSAKECHAKCLEAGANDYLPKPIHLGNLRSVMKVWLTPRGVFA